jgi:Mn-containing catalase
MPDKPSYLGLLNAIAVAETRAHEYLTAWIAVTPSPDVAAVLRTVAAREGEHGMTFAKRLDELGFQVRWKDDPESAKRLELAGASDCSDLEKMKALGLHRLDTGTKPDIFDKVFEDHSIDIRTGELLGRYIAEERDSARLLRACYEQLKAQAKAKGSAATESGDRLDAIESKLDAVCRAVDEVRQIVCAQSMPATPS